MFGAKGVFALRMGALTPGSGCRETAGAGRTAFGAEIGYLDLSRRFSRGAEIRRINLTDTFTLADFRAMHGERATLRFALDPKGRLEVFTAETPIEPTTGWTVLALIDPDSGASPGARVSV